MLQQLLEHGSVTRTSESLSLGQSTVSHALTRLRDLFEDPLFIRKSHGLEPTQRALQLQPKIEMLLDLTRDTLGIGHSFDPPTSSRMFSMSAPEFVTVTSATSLLNLIDEKAPNVGIRFLQLPEDEVFERLRRGDIDVAVGRFEQAPAEISLTLLYEDEFCIACRRGHPISRGKVTLQKYRSASHIWADSPSETIARDSEFDFSSSRGSIVSKWMTALIIAAQTDYIATCPRQLAESQAQLLNLEVQNLPSIETISVSLALRNDLHDRGVEWFVQQIKSLFG